MCAPSLARGLTVDRHPETLGGKWRSTPSPYEDQGARISILANDSVESSDTFVQIAQSGWNYDLQRGGPYVAATSGRCALTADESMRTCDGGPPAAASASNS